MLLGGCWMAFKRLSEPKTYLRMQITEKVVKSPTKVQNRPKKGNTVNKPKKAYSFLKRRRNPDYEGGVKRLPLESCLITTNGSKKKGENEGENGGEVHVKTRPKWYTDLLESEVDEETGEMIPKGVYTSDDFSVSNGKKIKALDRFCNHYEPLRKRRKVTLFFLTFTRANYAKLKWNTMSKIVVQYFKRLGIEVRGQIWTAEVSDRLHWHYHLVVATDRVNFRGVGIPAQLKFENLWGQRTEIDFVKKNVRHYMAKYFAKCDSRVIGTRSYGISRKLK